MDYQIKYGSSADLTITLAGLATSADLLTGRESTAVVNTTTLALDYLLSGKITTGTSPAASSRIQVCVVGVQKDTTWPDVFDGTDSGETVTNDGIKNAICRIAADITVSSTSNVGYFFGPVSVAGMFNGICPQSFVVFVTHNNTVNLHATAGNHVLSVVPVLAQLTA